jgi:transposase InsO family protein
MTWRRRPVRWSGAKPKHRTGKASVEHGIIVRYVFCYTKGQKAGQRITEGGFSKAWRKARIEAGCPGRIPLHVCVDDHSRAAYVEVPANQHATTAVGFLRRAVRWFAQRGVRVERVMTDNGSAYRAHRFHHACRLHGVRQIYTRFYRPQTNGKAERFIQTLLREWAYGVSYPSSWRRTRALRPWLRYYNGQRPHASLNYQSPASRFQRALQ